MERSCFKSHGIDGPRRLHWLEDIFGFGQKMVHLLCGGHPDCRDLQSRDFLPTRLVEISSGGLRLVKTSSSIYQQIEYVTLSHRWPTPGRSNMMKLGEANLIQFYHSIPEFSLPKPFNMR